MPRHTLPAFVLVTASASPSLEAQRPGLPPRLSDREFWQMVSDFSEPGGYFRSDNFLSNESSFQEVIPRLRAAVQPDGVYLGVGPEQNFSYIVALRPKIAFIFDIRRQNMLEHLLYKALMEMSADRAEFLSRLFGRHGPRNLPANIPVDSLFLPYLTAAPDSALFRNTLAAARELLIKRHGFTLTTDDLERIAYVYGAFFTAGPDLNYSFSSGYGGQFGGGRRMPTYAQLMTAADSAGVHRSYLASEDNFRQVKRLEEDNLIVPLVGDFAGEKAIRAVGRYLAAHGATVSAVYTSNVEQYLFQQGDDWKHYYDNVATLPIDDSSTFIRWVSRRGTPGPSRVTLLCPIVDLLSAYRGGRIATYDDVIQLSR
jgi:hypothetical protein